MKQKTDKTKDANYQKYVNSNDRKRAKGVVKQLKSIGSAFHIKMANDLLTNGGSAPIPSKMPNQKQRRKLAAQTR